jgi:hypothetical protein
MAACVRVWSLFGMPGVPQFKSLLFEAANE